MSEIKYSADLDTSKLESAIKQSNATIGDWAKGVEKAGTQADQGLGKMTKSFKDAIKEQKDLIKNIEADVKKLQKAYDDSAPGRAKQSAANELRSARKALAEEQGTLIGLQKQQIQANEQENSGISNLVGGIGKWVAGLFTVGAAMKITKSIINSTTDSADSFEKIIEGARGGVQYFFKTIASGDWTNFTKGLSESIRGAQEFVEAMKDIHNLQNEQQIRSSEYDIKIAELRDETYDKDDTNNERRKEALIEIIALQKQKYTEEADLAKKLYETNLDKAATDSGLAKEQIENFLKQYSSLEELIKKGEEYNKLEKLMYSPGMTASHLQNLEDLQKALGDNAEEAGLYVKQISKVTPEVRKMLSGYLADANKAEAAFGQRDRRDKMQLAEVTNAIEDAEEARRKKSEEDSKLVNQLTQQYELLDKAIADGNAAEIKTISAKLILLEKELTLRTNIAKAAILSSAGGPVNTISTESFGKAGLPSFTVSVQDNGLIGSPAEAKIKQARAKELGRQREWNIKDAENDERKIRDQKEILRGATELTFQLGRQLGLSEDQLNVLGAELDAFTQLATGNYIGAAANLLSQLISSFPSQTEKFADEVERLNALLERQQKIIDQSLRFGGTEDAIKTQINLLKQQADATIKTAMIMAGKGKGREAADLINQWEDIKASIEEANIALADFMSGGVTENTIADAIAQQLQEAESSVNDFADYMNQVLIDAVMNIFKSNILDSPLMKTYMDEAKKALSDNVLTEEEKNNLIKLGKEFSDSMKPTWEGLTGALDFGTGTKTGLTGQIQRSITEETGSELAGLMRRQSDDLRQVRDYSRLGIDHLTRIEANTFNTVAELQKANIKLDTVITNTKQVPTAAL